MLWSDLITSRSWRAGAKLVYDDLGPSISGVRRRRDLVQLTSAGDDDDDGDDGQVQQQQHKAESDVQLHDLVSITAGT